MFFLNKAILWLLLFPSSQFLFLLFFSLHCFINTQIRFGREGHQLFGKSFIVLFCYAIRRFVVRVLKTPRAR